MKNVTITLPENTLQRARVAAAKQGKSLSRFVSDLVTREVDYDPEEMLRRLSKWFDGPAFREFRKCGKGGRSCMPSGRTNCFVDTSVIVYTAEPMERKKHLIATSLLKRMISSRTLVLSPQSLNEIYRVITDKRLLLPRADARDLVADLSPFCTAPLDYLALQGLAHPG